MQIGEEHAVRGKNFSAHKKSFQHSAAVGDEMKKLLQLMEIC